jgi:hypothetical protein
LAANAGYPGHAELPSQATTSACETEVGAEVRKAASDPCHPDEAPGPAARARGHESIGIAGVQGDRNKALRDRTERALANGECLTGKSDFAQGSFPFRALSGAPDLDLGAAAHGNQLAVRAEDRCLALARIGK